MIIAVDFDGTLCYSKYPELGKPNNHLIRFLKEKKKEGCKLILWTCRCGDNLDKAIDWCKERGLIFDAVNSNVSEMIEAFECDSRKVFADWYIDDKGISLEILNKALKKGYVS